MRARRAKKADTDGSQPINWDYCITLICRIYKCMPCDVGKLSIYQVTMLGRKIEGSKTTKSTSISRQDLEDALDE